MRTASPFSNRTLIDTGVYFALVDTGDNNHEASVAIHQRLITEARNLFTTNFILAETHALILSRIGRDVAARVLREIDRSSVTIIRVSVEDEQQAREIIYRYDDKKFSFTDASSFAVMKRLRIGSAFTFDPNFVQYGLQVVGPDQP